MSLSFRIERPSAGRSSGSGHGHSNGRPPSSFAAQYTADSSEDEAEDERRRNHREAITTFDGSSRSHKKDEPLSIPVLPDRDFRALHMAKKRKKDMYRPEGGIPGTMKQSDDKAVPAVTGEGVDQMNARPAEGGLRVRDAPAAAETVPETGASTPLDQLSLSAAPSPPPNVELPRIEETDDQKALRELLSGESGPAPPTIDVIAMSSNAQADDSDDDEGAGGDETAIFRKDVASRPESASLEDYARVPVAQFGAALLRGMGWKEGTPATKTGREGPVEAYVPKARPSLLGIGAKPMQLDEQQKDAKAKKPERRYVPLVRKVTDRNARDSGNDEDAVAPRSRSRSPPSRRSSRSPPRSSSRRERYDSDREYQSDHSRRYESDRDRRRDRDDGYRERDGRRDRDRERDGGSRRYDSDRDSRGYRSDRDRRR